jgi:hypothetical protein
MKLKVKTYIYLAVVAASILANFILWRYRLHLYELNTDYERDPLHHIQMILFRGTEAIIVAGALFLSWSKLFGKN